MGKDIDLAVIATLLNERGNVERLLKDLLSQSRKPRQIVIVDGGSNDGTWETLLSLSQKVPILKVIKDESCSLRCCPGPIGRGRNRAIEEAEAEIIACADAGCHYPPNWLELLVGPIIDEEADYTIGGSYIDGNGLTVWDVAAAPFLGLDLPGAGMPRTPTGTARSLAFRKKIWEDIGKFSEGTLCGEDTEFLSRLKRSGKGKFVPEAGAAYLEHFTFKEALNRIQRYAQADGLNKLCRGRFLRMSGRAALGMLSLALLFRYRAPFVIYIVIELFFAFKHDFKGMSGKVYRPCFLSRILFSILVPYVFTYGYFHGLTGGAKQMNRQNT
jgi:glycosyltransferase involved in cell wall biosynthesis